MSNKMNICVDFDGVLNTYNGWKGEEELFEPMIGAREFLQVLSKKYNVIILSTRPYPKIWEWLKKYDLKQYVKDVTNHKTGAIAYIDDRGLKFDGNYSKVLKELDGFKAHWE